MQFNICFSGQLCVPIAYQYAVQSMIYSALSSEPEYQHYLHSTGYHSGGRSFKLFTFGRLQGRFTLQNGFLSFDEGVSLEIRSLDTTLIRLLCENFRKGSRHILCGYVLAVVSSELYDRKIDAEKISVKMLSPVTVYSTNENGKTCFYGPDDSNFQRLINKNAEHKWISIYGTIPPGIVSIDADKVLSRDKVVTTYKGIYITGWMGQYSIAGSAEMLNFLYNTGVGAKSSQGFGMFTVLDKDE